MSQRQERTDTSDLIRLGGLAMTMFGLSVGMAGAEPELKGRAFPC